MKKRISLLLVFALVLSLVFTMVACTETVEVTGVTLNKTDATLTVDQTLELTATVNPTNATDKTVTWASSAPEMATVSGTGVVTAVKAGTAAITVTTTDGSKTAACLVTVTAAPVVNVDVTSVSLNKATTSIQAGATETLTATVLPANATTKTVKWTSSATSVATVNGGVVTAVAAGTATITVTTDNGSKVATCVVTVTPNDGIVTGVTLDKNNVGLMMDVGFTTAKLTATITPAGAAGTVVWTSSATNVATVDNAGNITAKAIGRTTITATVGSFKAEAQVLVGNYTGSADALANGTTNGHVEVVVLTHVVQGVERVQDIIITDAYSYTGTTFTGTKVSATTPTTTTATYLNGWNNNVEDYINSLINLSINEAKAIQIATTGANGVINVPIDDYDFQKPSTTASTGQSFSILIKAVQDAFNATTAKYVSLDQNKLEILLPVTGIPSQNPGVSQITRQLTATVGAGTDKSITWVTDDSDVIEFDEDEEGLLIVRGLGKATVYVFTNNGRYAACEVSVVNPVSTFMILTQQIPGVALLPGGTADITTTYTSTAPAHTAIPTYKWTSSDTKVATVPTTNSGNITVTAVAPGTATITGTATTGSVVMTVTATITVTAPYGITPNYTSIEFQKEKVEEVQLTGTVNHYPALSGTQYWKFTYSSSDTGVATVSSSGVVVANPANHGTAIITMKATLMSGGTGLADVKLNEDLYSTTITVKVYETIKEALIYDKVLTDATAKEVTKVVFDMYTTTDADSISLYSFAGFSEEVASFIAANGAYDVKYEWTIADRDVVNFDASFTPDTKSNKSTSTIENVKVNMVGPGKTTITLKITTGSVSKSVSIPVTVYGLVIEQGDIGFIRGMSAQEVQLTTALTQKDLPEGATVTWSIDAATANLDTAKKITLSKDGLVTVAKTKAAGTNPTTDPAITQADGTVTVIAQIIVGGLPIYTTEIEVSVLTVGFTGLPTGTSFDKDGYLVTTATGAAAAITTATTLTFAPIIDLTKYEINILVINTDVTTATVSANAVTITPAATSGRAVVEIAIDFEYFGNEYQLIYTVVVYVAAP